MRLNAPLCDFLTLTSWSETETLQLLFWRLTPSYLREDGKVMQYRGKRGPHTFFGSANQNGKAHWMLRVSGELADEALANSYGIAARCTRLDLQVTVPAPDGFFMPNVYDALNDEDAMWTGRRKNVSMIQSGDGLDTLYVGSRTSETFIRIYIKPNADGEPAYVRFEVEFKGDTADSFWQAIRDGQITRRQILAGILTGLPETKNGLLSFFREPLGTNRALPPVKRVQSENSTLDWLQVQVEPAIYRLLHSHEHGGTMRTILRRWLDAADNS